MKNKVILSCLAASLLCSGATFAGGYERVVSMPGGFYVGVGAAENSLSVRHNGSITINGITFTGYAENQNTLSPAAQVGWWSDAHSFGARHLSLGARVAYSYLNSRPNSLGLLYESKNRVEHEVKGLLLINVSLMKKISMYFGAGFVVYPHVQNTWLPSEGSYESESHTLWGGAGQLGLIFQSCKSMFLDFSYDYAITGSKTFSHSNNAATYSRKLHVINQQVLLSMNYVL